MDEKELLEQGYRKYTGEKIDIFFKLAMCEHSANCINGHKGVFDLNRKPWIIADNASVDEIMDIIDYCPSRALKYIKK